MLDHTSAQLDPVPALLHQLETGNDVIRTGAVRALTAQARHDGRTRVALLAALLDEDPDVRGDAMAGLVGIARPGDAETIRRSLMGDPVREVKQAAVDCLTRLKDLAAIPLFRALLLSRAEETVAWEDENDVWDDWLDIQAAVIDALGQLTVTSAIPDMLAARDDEFGQTLDIPVFRALAAMGTEGAVWLLSVAQTEVGLARKRALEALAKVDPALLADQVDYLLADDLAEVRQLALPLVQADDARVADLVLNDPEPGMRVAALRRYGADAPDLVAQALSDPNETVQAAALGMMQPPLDPALEQSVVTKALAWMSLAGAALAGASADALTRLAPAMAADPLMALARDTARPLDARMAAVAGLGRLTDAAATERLIALLRNETQQVRTVALFHLAGLARQGDAAAAEALAMAIDGVLLLPDQAVVAHAHPAAPDLVAPKADTAPRGHLLITRDGEIIEDEGTPTDAVAQSTLGSIQQGMAKTEAPDMAEDTPEETALKRRKRRAIEGPETVADDLRQVALGVAGDVPAPTVEEAVLLATTLDADSLRLAAYRALLKRLGTAPLPALIQERALAGLSDPQAAIRSVAAQIIATDPTQLEALTACFGDEDALVRAVAVEHCAKGDVLLRFMADPVRAVRHAALHKIVATGDDDLERGAFDALLTAERIDTLGEALQRSKIAMALACAQLSTPDLPPRVAHLLIEALAVARVPQDGGRDDLSA